MKHVLVLLFSVMSSAALAQTTATVDPGAAPAQTLLNEAARPDNCTPIGLTGSGEHVFPLECRAFLERERAKAAEQKPATVQEKSAAVEEKPAAVAETPAAKRPEARQEAEQSHEAAPAAGKPAKKLLEAVSLPKRPVQEPRQRATSAGNCTHYRSYNPTTGSYRGYDGKTWGCRQAQAKR